MRRYLLAAALLCVASQAYASKCYIKEYGFLTATSGATAAQAAAEPSLVDQTAVDFTAGHAESAAFGSQTRYIRVWCDAQASYTVGSTPVAINTMSPLTASLPEYFGVNPGQKISFVANP